LAHHAVHTQRDGRVCFLLQDGGNLPNKTKQSRRHITKAQKAAQPRPITQRTFPVELTAFTSFDATSVMFPLNVTTALASVAETTAVSTPGTESKAFSTFCSHASLIMPSTPNFMFDEVQQATTTNMSALYV